MRIDDWPASLDKPSKPYLCNVDNVRHKVFENSYYSGMGIIWENFGQAVNKEN